MNVYRDYTFTLYPDGKFNIEYDYNNPEGYKESGVVITDKWINYIKIFISNYSSMLITKKNALKSGLILLLLIITFTNTFRKFDGNFVLEIIFLIAQLYYSIYGGFYAYLFDKPMSGKFSSIDFIQHDTENNLIRRWWLLVHILIFALIQMR